MPNKNDIDGPRGFLRLVTEHLDEAHLGEEASFQLGLFPEVDPLVMSFFHIGFLRHTSLLEISRQLNPGVIFDVRVFPSFRSFDVDRRDALDYFNKHRMDYVDVSGLLGDVGLSDLNSELVPSFICDYVSLSTTIRGPMMFIFDKFDSMKFFAEKIPVALNSKLKKNFRAQVFVGER